MWQSKAVKGTLALLWLPWPAWASSGRVAVLAAAAARGTYLGKGSSGQGGLPACLPV